MPSPIEQVAGKIIKEQELIIGPLAWSEAGKVTGLQLDIQTHSIQVIGESRQVLEGLVKQYERLFGPASLEVCKNAIQSLKSQLKEDEIPAVLK